MNDNGEKVKIYFDMKAKKFVMDRAESGKIDFGQPNDTEEVKKTAINYVNNFALGTWAPISLCKGGKYHLNIFVDRSSVEIFVDGGRIAMTNLVFPTTPYDKMHFLFDKMSLDLDEELRPRFIPYIQLHEFEALLFSDISVFNRNFTSDELDFHSLEQAINSVDTPEEFNNGPATAPSERLKKAIKGYDKVVYGACLASEIGLDTIREKCKMFNEWIEKLETC